MKVSDRFRSIEKVEVESKVEKYKGPDSIKQDEGIKVPQEIVDTFENARSNTADDFLGVADVIRDKFNQSKDPQISSPVSKYNGPDSLEIAKPISEVQKYKGPKSLPTAEESKGSDRVNQDIDIPDEVLDQFNRARNNQPDPFIQLTKILQDHKEESSEPKIVSKANQYKGPKYIGDK